MIKRVIFDIDNTLIPWESEYDKEIEKTLDELNIQYTEQEYKEIRKAFSEYEKVNYRFDKKIMLDYINKYMKKQYPIEFMDKVLERWGNCVPEKIEDSVKDTLVYLKNKYEMVILTDWFAKEQINRLKILDINKYFSQVYDVYDGCYYMSKSQCINYMKRLNGLGLIIAVKNGKVVSMKLFS